MLNARFSVQGNNLEQIVDNLEGYLIDLRQAQFKENFADSPKVQFYLEEGDD
jgi:hypothetical protein